MARSVPPPSRRSAPSVGGYEKVAPSGRPRFRAAWLRGPSVCGFFGLGVRTSLLVRCARGFWLAGAPLLSLERLQWSRSPSGLRRETSGSGLIFDQGLRRGLATSGAPTADGSARQPRRAPRREAAARPAGHRRSQALRQRCRPVPGWQRLRRSPTRAWHAAELFELLRRRAPARLMYRAGLAWNRCKFRASLLITMFETTWLRALTKLEAAAAVYGPDLHPGAATRT